MRVIFNTLTLIIGTLSFAGALVLSITPLLTKHWTRRWLRVRLGNTTFAKGRLHLQPVATSRLSSTEDLSAPVPLAITDFLDAIARDVRSGFSLTASFVQCSDRQPENGSWSEPVARRLLHGIALSDALVECALPTWTPEIRFASRTLAIASAGGLGVAHALEHSASILREQHGLTLDRDMQSAQAQLSTKVLTWLPLAVFAWICVTDPVARLFLLSTPAGICCVATGITFNISGRKWMSRVVENISV